MLTRVYRKEKYQCPHCAGIIRAPSEPIEFAPLAVSPLIVVHDCPKLEKKVPVRFTITGLLEIEAGEEMEVVGNVSGSVRADSVSEPPSRMKRKCPD